MPEILSNRWYYANTAAGFLEDTKKEGYISQLLHDRFVERRQCEPSISLLHSWEASPLALADALEKGKVRREEVVVLEYCLDAGHRIDALICGYEKDEPTVVLIEMKQWDQLPIRSCENDNFLEMQFPHGWKQVEHPSAQVMRYRNKMNEILNEPFPEQPQLTLIPYAFLHNPYLLSEEQLTVLRGEKFGELFKRVPIYTYMGARALGNRIHERTRHQRGIEVLKQLGEF